MKTMTRKEGLSYARNRGRVINTQSGQVGNLVDWLPGAYCKVFTGYASRIGAYQPANFETWPKALTRHESNDVPVTHNQSTP